MLLVLYISIIWRSGVVISQVDKGLSKRGGWMDYFNRLRVNKHKMLNMLHKQGIQNVRMAEWLMSGNKLSSEFKRVGTIRKLKRKYSEFY